MSDRLILHDLPPDVAASGFPSADGDGGRVAVFSQSAAVRPCVGCFGCWVKTPGRCVMADHDSRFATLMPRADELVVVSRLVFGGFSPNVKAVLDRSIGYMLPFFRKLNGEMHHVQRYEKRLVLRYLFYGKDLPEAEKETARQLIRANALNLGAKDFRIDFFDSPEEALGVLR